MRHHETLGSLRKYVGDCNKNGKRAAGFDWQKNNFARTSRIFLHVFAFDARLQSETSYFHVLWRTWTQLDNNFLFLKFDTVLQNSTPEKFAIICPIEWDGINTIKFEVARILFLSDIIFLAVFVVVTYLTSFLISILSFSALSRNIRSHKHQCWKIAFNLSRWV